MYIRWIQYNTDFPEMQDISGKITRQFLIAWDADDYYSVNKILQLRLPDVAIRILSFRNADQAPVICSNAVFTSPYI